GTRFFVTPDSPAQRQADAWRSARPEDAALMDRMAAQPIARWIGDWNTDVRGDVARFTARAVAQAATPMYVAYNIPNRDCGSYSAGGASSADGYRKWIADFEIGRAHV